VTSSYEAALYYTDTLKWYLVPIPPGTKGPTTIGWNNPDNAAKPEYWKLHSDNNMGVLLAPSNIVVFDIDSIEDTKILLSEFGLNYDILLKNAPRIKGRQGHDKAIFKAPPGIELTAKKLPWENKDNSNITHTVFELRGGLVQDVLPPSIHPDTKQPYEWLVEPNEIPPLPKELLSIWIEWDKFRPQLVNACPWAKKIIPSPQPKKEKTVVADDNIIQRFNDSVTITSILENNGYKRITPTRYLSPYSTTGIPGVHIFPNDNRIFSHHGSEPFDSSKSHDAFDMFCHFECGGDMIAALKQAASQLGIQTEFEKSITHGAEISKAILAPKPISEIEHDIQLARERNLLPTFPPLDDGIFKEYVELGKRVSYSLEEYHFASLLAVASMVIGRKAVVKVGMTNIYPNVFVMIVGQTTISGKSVACNIAVNSFGKSIEYEEPIAKYNSTNTLRGTISEPALIQGLHDTYNSFWFYDDCAGFFEDITAWNAHILGTMCSLYDGSAVERTLSKRKNGDQFKWSCPSPFVSLLFNTTTKDIEQIASARLFSSGFFPRLMWFYGQGGQPRKNEDVKESDKKILADINTKLKSVRSILAAIPNDSISFGVCNRIEDWKIDATLNRLGKEDESYRTAISRGFIHAYKIATILTVLDGEQPLEAGTYQIPDNHACMAIRLVEQYLIPRMMYVYEMCNSADAKNHQVIVMKSLNHFGGTAERSKILRQTHLGKKELDLALTTMQESGEIICHCVTRPGACKPTMIIIKQ
jgi:hypothetical protein